MSPRKHKSRALAQARLRISEIYSELLYRISSYLAGFYTEKASVVKMNRFMTLVVGAPRRASSSHSPSSLAHFSTGSHRASMVGPVY